jgi:hypothetical protein
MANNTDEQIHGQVEKLVQIGKVEGGVTIEDTSESYARCPICKRNDEVKKVSAIVVAETHNLNGVTIEKKSYTDQDGKAYDSIERVPFTGNRASSLAQYLSPPEKPRLAGTKYDTRITIFQLNIWLGIALAVVSILVGFWWSVALGAAYAFLYSLLNNHTKSLRDALLKEMAIKLEPEMTKWNRAMERWDDLYYCSRNDCVFVPGENTSVSSSRMMAYLYQD